MTLEKAISLATRAHEGQVDLLGQPYIRHCLRVMEACAPDVDAMIVGVLHDVLEDGSEDDAYTLGTLGFGEPIRQALHALTRDNGEPYPDYIQRIKQAGPLAVKVKIADLEDNLDRYNELRRIDKEKADRLWDKYTAALRELRG